MGATMSRRHRPETFWRQSLNPDDNLIHPKNWKANDPLYRYLELKREKLEDRDLGTIMRMVVMYCPCQASRCKCKAGNFMGDKHNTEGWTHSNCIRSGCNHLLSDHTLHLTSASRTKFMALVKLVFDINNIKASLEIAYQKPKSQRNIVIEEVYNSVYKVLCKSVRGDPFKAPNFDKIYGSPPYEKIHIEQILINFCMRFFGSNKAVLTFEEALMVTKIVLHLFNSWMWTIPDNKSHDQHLYSNSYSFYYSRYMVHCAIPRLSHSISPRYQATAIFGSDVLKYTLKSFSNELQVWCYKSNIMWNEHTNLYCMTKMPIYMNLLKKEV
ncbi:unnamed protein product [Aphis gossypii]|uniref:PCAF N-terminal domain-containing protein n=1 Tax=Aphis gossypii TaxID=80765 RepID=A0A9P0JGT6_APHGO|nr:unnamed protein product [Aphis gossypii]